MANYVIVNGELCHYGVKGMKWGRRRFQNTNGSLTPAGEKRYGSGGIAETIRKKQRVNAEKDLDKIRSQQRQVDSELRELRGYERNPSALGKSKLSTAIRRSQIKSLERSKASLKALEKENIDALNELDSIERYQVKKRADKMLKKMNKQKIKDLYKQYGELEDQLDYGKHADAKKNAQIEKRMIDIDDQIIKLKKR